MSAIHVKICNILLVHFLFFLWEEFYIDPFKIIGSISCDVLVEMF